MELAKVNPDEPELSWSTNPLFEKGRSEKTRRCHEQSTEHRCSLTQDYTRDHESESGFYESDSTTSDVSYGYSRAAVLPGSLSTQGADTVQHSQNSALVGKDFCRNRLLTDIINDESFEALEQEFAKELGQPVNDDSSLSISFDKNEELPLTNTCQLTSSRRSSTCHSEFSNCSSSCPSTIIFRRESDRYCVFKVSDSKLFRFANTGFTKALDIDQISSFNSSLTDVSDEVTNDSSSLSSSDFTFSLEELTKEFDISNEDLPEMRRSALWITSQYDTSDTVGSLPESQAQILSARGTVRGVKNRVRANIKHLLAASSGFEKRGIDQDGQHPEHGLVVIYTTGLRLIRSTNLECHYVKKVFHNLMVQIDERDVLMNPLYKNELELRLGTNKYTLPQVFIDGKHIGGAQEIERLVETGQMKDYLQNTPRWDTSKQCDTCGGYRYITCKKCFGSGKSRRMRISRELSQLRCSSCRDGLVKCPTCDVTNLIVHDEMKEENET